MIRTKAAHGNGFGLLISLVKRISWDLAGISHERLERGLGVVEVLHENRIPALYGA